MGISSLLDLRRSIVLLANVCEPFQITTHTKCFLHSVTFTTGAIDPSCNIGETAINNKESNFISTKECPHRVHKANPSVGEFFFFHLILDVALSSLIVLV